MGTDGPTDRLTDGPTDGPTNAVSYGGATSRLKTIKVHQYGYPMTGQVSWHGTGSDGYGSGRNGLGRDGPGRVRWGLFGQGWVGDGTGWAAMARVAMGGEGTG
jgi:hypothetical protein